MDVYPPVALFLVDRSWRIVLIVGNFLFSMLRTQHMPYHCHIRIILLLFHQHRIREPIRAEYFHDKFGCKDPSYLISNDFSPILGEAAERLLHRLSPGSHIQRVLGQLPRNTLQVLCGPSKNIPILTEEVDELAFLFIV